MAALAAFDIDNDDGIRNVITLMNDTSEQVRLKAKEKLDDADYQNAQVLIDSLTVPRRNIREGIFDLLTSQDIKDLDVYRYVRSQVEKGYIYLAEGETLRLFPESRYRDLLISHFEQKRRLLLDNILRVLVTQDPSGQIKIIWRGIFSSDSRQQSNSIEALEDQMDRSLTKVMVPLIDNIPAAEKMEIGRKQFQISPMDHQSGKIAELLLSEEDWVTLMLAIPLLADAGNGQLEMNTLKKLAASESKYVRRAARSAIEKVNGNIVEGEKNMEVETSITDKILILKNINLFESLSVSELAAVASVAEGVPKSASMGV